MQWHRTRVYPAWEPSLWPLSSVLDVSTLATMTTKQNASFVSQLGKGRDRDNTPQYLLVAHNHVHDTLCDDRWIVSLSKFLCSCHSEAWAYHSRRSRYRIAWAGVFRGYAMSVPGATR